MHLSYYYLYGAFAVLTMLYKGYGTIDALSHLSFSVGGDTEGHMPRKLQMVMAWQTVCAVVGMALIWPITWLLELVAVLPFIQEAPNEVIVSLDRYAGKFNDIPTGEEQDVQAHLALRALAPVVENDLRSVHGQVLAGVLIGIAKYRLKVHCEEREVFDAPVVRNMLTGVADGIARSPDDDEMHQIYLDAAAAKR